MSNIYPEHLCLQDQLKDLETRLPDLLAYMETIFLVYWEWLTEAFKATEIKTSSKVW